MGADGEHPHYPTNLSPILIIVSNAAALFPTPMHFGLRLAPRYPSKR
ncbi:hypothetical protein Arad_2338 [Rhizobium rhizogenes K84]|uniref:Uncharacterized protein n=1 Tax=Rhizobium rhizogenes (strain K84 / ATCC BAA-868) TaxID=311403 RepID=B9JF65_RHIR8|nr:hypothetical protein Arad_2338 [Rhizobium rhizogenes K84]